MKNFIGAVGIVSLAGMADAQFFQADSAVAGSEFSSSYRIVNTINGSGLPGGFGLTTPHDPYSNASGGNHWTTAANAILNGTAWAEYSFNTAKTIGTFHMWNHQSNGGLASNPDYDVTKFNLKLYDASNVLLHSLLNVVAQEDITIAQNFAFAPIANVKKVRFEILANARPNNDAYTGLGEVRFSSVPEPATMVALGLGSLALLRRRPR